MTNSGSDSGTQSHGGYISTAETGSRRALLRIRVEPRLGHNPKHDLFKPYRYGSSNPSLQPYVPPGQ